MTPRLRTVLIAALAAAAALGVGIGIGAAIWEGGSASPSSPATPAANATTSWLFVVTADAGVVTATGSDALKIELRGTAPRAVAFTDRPQREAKAVKTPALWAALYADGAAPPNAALSFEHAGEAVVVPLEMLNVTGGAPNYTIAARALGAGGLSYLAAEMVGNGAAVVRGPGDPLWAALQAGLAVEAPELFVDDVDETPAGVGNCGSCSATVAAPCSCGCSCHDCGGTWTGCGCNACPPPPPPSPSPPPPPCGLCTCSLVCALWTEYPPSNGACCPACPNPC
jgi:hypothetical protein